MRKLLVVLALVLTACDDIVVTPGGGDGWWGSVRWEYAYSTADYREGLDSVVGQLRFALDKNRARVYSDSEVVGYFFWGGDTLTHGPITVWRAGLELEGSVAPSDGTVVADTFVFATASIAAWPASGKYFFNANRDTLAFEWVEQTPSESFELRVWFVRP